MKCDEVVRELPMYGYGEISAEIEERIEAHLSACTACKEELARYRSFVDVLDERVDASRTRTADHMPGGSAPANQPPKPPGGIVGTGWKACMVSRNSTSRSGFR